MSEQPMTQKKVDVTRCEQCGADRGGVVTRKGDKDRFLCFQCEARAQAAEGGQPQ